MAGKNLTLNRCVALLTGKWTWSFTLILSGIIPHTKHASSLAISATATFSCFAMSYKFIVSTSQPRIRFICIRNYFCPITILPCLLNAVPVRCLSSADAGVFLLCSVAWLSPVLFSVFIIRKNRNGGKCLSERVSSFWRFLHHGDIFSHSRLWDFLCGNPEKISTSMEDKAPCLATPYTHRAPYDMIHWG